MSANGPMRALSLWQPWAVYVAIGAKTREMRGWHPKDEWTGQIAIHAGLSRDVRPLAAEVEPGSIAVAALKAVPAQLRGAAQAVGAIVAVADLTGYHRGSTGGRCTEWCDPDVRWHWELSGAVILPEPVRVAGRRGLWTLPADVEKAVRSRLAAAAV